MTKTEYLGLRAQINSIYRDNLTIAIMLFLILLIANILSILHENPGPITIKNGFFIFSFFALVLISFAYVVIESNRNAKKIWLLKKLHQHFLKSLSLEDVYKQEGFKNLFLEPYKGSNVKSVDWD